MKYETNAKVMAALNLSDEEFDALPESVVKRLASAVRHGARHPTAFAEREMLGKINNVEVAVRFTDGVLVVDCSRPGDFKVPSDPRFWLERGHDDENRMGWKLLMHPDAADPSHCVFIADEDRNIIVYDDSAPDADWPGSNKI